MQVVLSCALWYASVCSSIHKHKCPVIPFIPLIGQAPCSELRSHKDPLSCELTFDRACLHLTVVLLGKYFNQHLNSCLTNEPISTILLYNLKPLGNSLYKISESKLREEHVCFQAGSQQPRGIFDICPAGTGRALKVDGQAEEAAGFLGSHICPSSHKRQNDRDMR